MKDLIEALNIFLKYNDDYAPTHCEHDVLMVCVGRGVISSDDQERLQSLGFFWSDEYDCWASFRFGSA